MLIDGFVDTPIQRKAYCLPRPNRSTSLYRGRGGLKVSDNDDPVLRCELAKGFSANDMYGEPTLGFVIPLAQGNPSKRVVALTIGALDSYGHTDTGHMARVSHSVY